MNIVLEGFGKAYGGIGPNRFWAVRDFSLTFPPGQFVTIVGPSGCGKSTVLNAIAGFVDNYEGRLELDGVPVAGPGYDRSVVFQSASLLPWRDVTTNVAYGMQLQKRLSSQEISERTDWAIRLVGLDAFRRHFPSQLSGGMQQRVNLARALATHPRVMLMDEPFGALDAMTKERLQEQLMDITQQSEQSVIFITCLL